MASDPLTFEETELKIQLEEELKSRILPFWMEHVVDRVNGGFYGAVTNDLEVHNEVPRSAVLCARILWTYARAAREWGGDRCLWMARWAYEYLRAVFWDRDYGGLYWQVDRQGRPVSDRKYHYAQAFAIYGLSEYYLAVQEPLSLALAQALFHLLEKHAYEAVHRGYQEASSRDWEPLADIRLSGRDLDCRKSMNTMLHILEAYTNLMRIWDDAHLKAQHKALIEAFQQHIIDHRSGHFRLFFDARWRSLSDTVSYGHDIEGSWLLQQAAEAQDEAALGKRVRECALSIAASVYREGLDADGSLFYEGSPRGLVDTGKAWWVQAEAVVGFYNAYQLSGFQHFRQASYRCWRYIQTKMVDREYGEWYKQLDRDGRPDRSRYKAGPWDCPYHQSRMCFEMLARLKE